MFFVGATLQSTALRARMVAPRTMTKRREITCNECYFRQAGLCALGDGPCPTFRPAKTTRLEPPHQPELIARPLRAHAAA